MSDSITERARALCLAEEAGAMWCEEAATCAEFLAAAAEDAEDREFFGDRAETFRARTASMRANAEGIRWRIREAIAAEAGGAGIRAEDLERYANVLSRAAATAARAGSILAADDPLIGAVAAEAGKGAATAIRFLEAEAAAVSSLVGEARS